MACNFQRVLQLTCMLGVLPKLLRHNKVRMQHVSYLVCVPNRVQLVGLPIVQEREHIQLRHVLHPNFVML